ncbi:exosortase-associated EpsI family protein [Chloroflexi bacterium TSY]|nr:exosortase-associated EpsI family protein [Chloroflexi bacterium TSY]
MFWIGLNDIPLTVGKWQSQKESLIDREVEILLDPEQYVRRLYQHQNGQYIWLTLIGGRSSRAFHPPDICYDVAGWQYNLGSRTIMLNSGDEIQALWMEAEKHEENQQTLTEHVISYFFIFPDEERELVDGIVLFKLTSTRLVGADETLNLHADFVRNFFINAQ